MEFTQIDVVNLQKKVSFSAWVMETKHIKGKIVNNSYASHSFFFWLSCCPKLNKLCKVVKAEGFLLKVLQEYIWNNIP